MNSQDLDRHICGDTEEFVIGSSDERVPVTSDMLEPARFLQAAEIGNCDGCGGPCRTKYHVCPLYTSTPYEPTAMGDQGQLQAALNHVYGQHPSFAGWAPTAHRTGVPEGGSAYNQVAYVRLDSHVQITYRDGVCRILVQNSYPDVSVAASQAEAIGENLCLAAEVCRQLDSRQM